MLRLLVPDDWTSQQIFAMAAGHGLQVRHLRASVPSLEDVFASALAAPSAEGVSRDDLSRRSEAGSS
jgi:hypothetical protein